MMRQKGAPFGTVIPKRCAFFRLSLDRLEVGGSVLAQRADKVVGQNVAFINITADLADKALLSFGLGLRLNMQDCERALLILQGEMEYGHTPLMEACEEVSVRIGGIVGSFFAQIAKKLNTHEGALETIWCQTARKVLTKSQMEKEEREEWEKLGGTLGYLDLEMQVSTIQIYVRRLKLRMEQTEKESHERLRMYPVIGAFSGVLICLLLV